MESKTVFSFAWEGTAVGINDKPNRGNAKVNNPAYNLFIDDIAFTCRAATRARGIERRLFIEIRQLIDRARDADSLVKPIFDGIERSAVIADDNQLRDFSVSTFDKERGRLDQIQVIARLNNV